VIIFATQCYASTAYAIMQCLSVRLSVTFVHSVKTNKRIYRIFHHWLATLVTPF